ncbi:MAG TPA: Rieske (2Fe-2S) protein [Planctomycetota bacterium]|jgi:Rieske Fe-S protein|nr:Rieske (2Fe-2S) protein [Planctomycetota bacterium]
MPAWKHDFPVSWADDHYVTRREFTKSLVLVSCAASVANGALVAMGEMEKRRGPEHLEPRKIASVHELPVGASRVFGFPGPEDPCLLVRLDADRFVAFRQKCTHLGCPVLYRKESGKLHCPCHEGYFSAEDGKVLAGPPPRPLPRIELLQKGDELWAMGIQA